MALVGSPFGKATVIVNSRAGRVARNPTLLGHLLMMAGLEFEIRMTGRPGHAVDLARAAIEEGAGYLVAAGGDGTIHEVVNGMMGDQGPRNPEAVLGVLSAGSGCDLARTFGLPSDPADAVERLKGDNVSRIDAGRVTYTMGDETQSRYFINIAEAGLGGEIARRARRLPRSFGQVRYLLSFWRTLGGFRASEARVALGERDYQGHLMNLVVANAQFFGGGMRIAPKASPSDGMLDVLVMKGTKRDYVSGIVKVYKGSHLPSPAIKEYQAQRVEVTSHHALQVEADGEILGTTPAIFEVVEGAVRLKI